MTIPVTRTEIPNSRARWIRRLSPATQITPEIVEVQDSIVVAIRSSWLANQHDWCGGRLTPLAWT